MRIVNAGHDEKGEYTGGIAGDQTGNEIYIRNFYIRPWDVVARAIDPYLGNMIANIALCLALLPQVGYDQGERLALWKQCEAINWDVTRLPTIEFCECDCSSMIPVILKFCDVEIPPSVTTSTLVYYLSKTGKFEFFRNDILTDGERLKRGDILINEVHHCAIAVDDGQRSSSIVDYEAIVCVDTYLQVRTTPAIELFNELKVDGNSQRLINGLHVRICEHAGNWGRLADCNAWVNLTYIRKVADNDI